MADVVAVHGGRVPGEPWPDLVETIEEILAEAKAGRLTGMAFATTYEDGGIQSGWTGAAGTRHTLGTGIMILQARYLRAIDDAGVASNHI